MHEKGKENWFLISSISRKTEFHQFKSSVDVRITAIQKILFLMHECMHVCMYECVHVWMCACMMYVYMYDVCMNECMYVRMNECMNAWMYGCILMEWN